MYKLGENIETMGKAFVMSSILLLIAVIAVLCLMMVVVIHIIAYKMYVDHQHLNSLGNAILAVFFDLVLLRLICSIFPAKEIQNGK